MMMIIIKIDILMEGSADDFLRWDSHFGIHFILNNNTVTF